MTRILLSLCLAVVLSVAVARDATASSPDVPAVTAVRSSPAPLPHSGPTSLPLVVGMAVAAAAAAKKKDETPRQPDDPNVEHVSPGIDVERKKHGKYHGLDPWDTATLLVSQPGTGRVYDVREMPQTRPGFVQGEDGREFAIGENVIAVADGSGGGLREPAFDKNRQADDDATGSK